MLNQGLENSKKSYQSSINKCTSNKEFTCFIETIIYSLNHYLKNYQYLIKTL